MLFLQEVSTTPTLWMDPKFLLTAAVAFIGFVAWLIRLEAKVNGMDKGLSKVEQSCEDTWDAFEQHRGTDGIHFNQRLANEVEARQKDRMDRMQSDIMEIKELVKGIASNGRH